MAVVSAAITGAILSASQGGFPGSQNLPRIATAVGRSLPQWLPLLTNVTVLGVATGVAGVGAVNGKLFVGGGVPLVVAALKQAGLAGPTAVGIGTAVGAGVSSILNSTAQYVGASPGVGVGADASKVSFTNSATLIAVLLSNLRAAGVSGPQGPQLATGLGRGLAQLVQTGFGVGGVVGLPSPVSAVSTSISTVF
jgi:hypothetical protein